MRTKALTTRPSCRDGLFVAQHAQHGYQCPPPTAGLSAARQLCGWFYATPSRSSTAAFAEDSVVGSSSDSYHL